MTRTKTRTANPADAAIRGIAASIDAYDIQIDDLRQQMDALKEQRRQLASMLSKLSVDTTVTSVPKPRRKTNRNARPVRITDNETGLVVDFASTGYAEKFIGVSRGIVCHAIERAQDTSIGQVRRGMFSAAYIDEIDPNHDVNQLMSDLEFCNHTTGEILPDAIEAAVANHTTPMTELVVATKNKD